MKKPTLFVQAGRQKGTTFTLDASTIRMGRSSTNDIQVLDEEASRFHAEIRIGLKSAMMIDTGSANGTYVNGDRIKLAELYSGDEILIGKTRFLFTDSESPLSSSVDPLLTISQDVDLLPRDLKSPADSPHSGMAAPRSGMAVRESSAEPESDTSSRFRVSPVVVAEAQSSLQALFATLDVIRKTSDEHELLQKVLDHIFRLTTAQRGAVLLRQPGTNEMRPAVARDGSQKATPRNRIRISETIINYVMDTGQGVLTHDARADERWKASDSMLGTEVFEAICVPLQGRHQILGVLYVDNRMACSELDDTVNQRRFREQQLETAVAVGQQAALAIEYSRYYSELLEKERLAAIGQLAAGVSHNIKNLMQGTESGSYLVQSGLNTQDWNLVERGWKIVQNYQAEVSRTLMNILSFNIAKKPLLTATHFPQLLERVRQYAINLAEPHGVRISLENRLPSVMEWTAVDSQGVYHALVNLVTNAIDACKESPDGRIKIKCRPDEKGEHIVTEIVDNGCGIPEEKQSLVFNEFFTSKGQRGTGIGLMITKKLIDEHQGKIEFNTSRSGTTFFVMLPIKSPKDVP